MYGPKHIQWALLIRWFTTHGFHSVQVLSLHLEGLKDLPGTIWRAVWFYLGGVLRQILPGCFRKELSWFTPPQKRGLSEVSGRPSDLPMPQNTSQTHLEGTFSYFGKSRSIFPQSVFEALLSWAQQSAMLRHHKDCPASWAWRLDGPESSWLEIRPLKAAGIDTPAGCLTTVAYPGEYPDPHQNVLHWAPQLLKWTLTPFNSMEFTSG